MNIKRTLLINGQPVTVDAERGASGELTVDAFMRLDQVDPDRKVLFRIITVESLSYTLGFQR